MGEFKAVQHPTQTVVICALKRANDSPEATPPAQAVQFSRSAAGGECKAIWSVGKVGEGSLSAPQNAGKSWRSPVNITLSSRKYSVET
jgi:hypothetical protein